MIVYTMAGLLLPALFLLISIVDSQLHNPLLRDAANSPDATFSLTDIDMRCPEGWEREGAKCFRAYYLERSWPQALIFCGRYGSLLARIESQRENAFLARLLNRPQRSASATTKTDYWIGLISQESGDDDAFFLWSDGTLVSRYIGFWGKGQPDYRSGSCAKAKFGSPSNLFWELEMCNMLLPFVCELPACIKGSFFCQNGGCIPESAHCNGIDDCGDLSDELNCPASHNELACFKYEKGESGKILSPNYPSPYRPNSHCRWVIEGPINSRIQLTFDEFETEENQDLVTVIDGGPSENASVVIDTISGSPKPERLSFASGTNMMVVRFRADALVQARGFQASWRAVSFSCGGSLKAQLYEQSFSSPEYPHNYPNGMECVWRIDAPEGQLISLNIQDFELEVQRDFVIVYDGPTPSAPILARLTGQLLSTTTGAPQLIISSQNVLYIYFYSNYAIGGKGFAMSYKRGCDNTIKQNYGALLSPGHTRVPYPGSQVCKYTIELPDGQNDQPISVSINHFDVARDDSLQIYEGSEYGRALHEGQGFNEDHRPPKIIHAKQSQVQLVFTTNAVRNTMGWNLTFSTNCPALNVPKMVSISTQNTAFGTKVTIACPRGFEFVTGRGQSFEVHCKLGGKWTEEVIPTCQPIYCSSVPQIANGFAVSATNVSFGGMAKYSCYEGFAFESGKKMEEIYCTDEGRWTKTPRCRAATCSALEHFEHGDRVLKFGDGTGYGTVFAFECEPGYRRVGAATMLCQTNGTWSAEQPRCEKLVCTNIPKIQHGRIALDAPWLEFGDSAKVECEPGFRNVGTDSVKCLANQTLSGTAECQDIDECIDGTANCSPKSTGCVNMPGGYHCQCQRGYQPQLTCTNSASLIPVKGKASSEDEVFRYFSYASAGWCAQSDDKNPSLLLTFAVPKVIDRIRLEKVGNAFPTVIRFNYANETGVRLNQRSEKVQLKKLAVSGSELLVLGNPLEARVLQLEILEFHERGCVKLDLLGCQKTNCIDENECENHNGYCEHHCMNTQGSYRCSCEEGYDLFAFDGQGGIHIKEGETGEGLFDMVRFNKCNRPGYEPYPWKAINCTLGTACVLSEDVGISSGFIPDGAFADNSETTTWGYEPHKARMSSTGWCGYKDAFIFLSVDLQRIYTLTTLRIAGVAGSGYLKGHVTKMQLFYKVQFSQSYDTYPIEFEMPSGNHNKMYQFELNPPLRARYVLLGITEYETNPCLRFDMQGCLAPLSAAHEIPSHLQVGWNASVPQCIDAEPPVFHNCPQNPIYITTDDHGQLMPANFEAPQATDNSGFIAFMRVRPSKFEPPRPVDHDMDVVYTAFDEAGNSAECVVKLRIPDTQPPVMKCPDSYALSAKPGQMEQLVYFNESTVPMVIQDMSNITEIVFDPTKAVVKLGSHVNVEVTATDAHANKNKCKFQVALMQEPCSEMSLQTSENAEKVCSKQSSKLTCKIQCKEGYRFVDPWTEPDSHKFTCSNGIWSPNNNPPACVKIAQEPARYELVVAVRYAVSTPVGQECLKGYTDLVAAFFDTMDTVLTQRCSSSVQVFVRFLDVKFTSSLNEVTANYTIQILPTVLQDVFYELCGLTLRTIFDLRIPGASGPIRNVLSISGETIATPGNGCPSLNATSTSVSQGFGCADGEILRGGHEKETLPECLPCSRGTVFVNNTCVPCPVGSYQDEEGHLTCKACPDHTFTLFPGAQSLEACIAVCGNGMFSETGLIPCQLCPRHTFAGPPVFGGFKHCEPCPEGTYTARLGSTGPSQCKQPCQVGFFSVSGLEPCSPCPVNHYQPNLGQQRCIECPNNTYTRELGRSLEAHCEKLDCSPIKCQNKATCAIINHKTVCECRPGFTGQFCEEQISICDSDPCYNGGRCEAVAGTFRCVCPPNYTGTRCQFGPDECIGINCPNGGVCQDLPGLGTTKCICRTGFTGLDCSQIADPCQMANPCRNGADCIPLQLGRYKCKCLPGWEGQNCEHNIGRF
uniref:Fibropellin-1 n=1 Tax=Acrobeloides nanus TaxID=290746 RepID=A0A914C4L0_9BILA